MTRAENFPNNCAASNVLYAKLRARFCPNGDMTIGQRMLQASAAIRQVETSPLPANDVDTGDAVFSPVLASHAEMRHTALRNFCAIFLASVVLICLLTSVFRLIGNGNDTSLEKDAYPYTAVTVDTPAFDNALVHTKDGFTENEAGALLTNSDKLLTQALTNFNALGK